MLSEFRDRLLRGGLEQRLLDALLAHLAGKGLLTPGGRVRTDSAHVLAAVRMLNRVENLAVTMRGTGSPRHSRLGLAVLVGAWRVVRLQTCLHYRWPSCSAS